MSELAETPPMPPREDHHANPPSQPPTVPPRREKTRMLAGFVIVAAILAVGIAFAILSRVRTDKTMARETQESAVTVFNVVHPSSVAVASEISLPGSAQAYKDTAIYARTNGYLQAWKADIGTHVKQGDVLAEIETPEVDQQLEQARADLKNAQANRDLAQITESRAEDLFKNKTISGQEKDQAASDLTAKRALVDSGQANVRRLEQLKAFQKVVAPFDGVITARNTDVGALINSTETSSAKELFHLADNHILRIYFSVPEIYASTVKHDEEAMITFDAFPGEKFTGKLIRDSASLDPLSHTLNVEADVENPSGRLFPGGYATVHLKIPGTPGAVTIPANTLLFRAEGPSVAVVRDGHVALTAIEIGHDLGNTIEVLGGLTTQDAVILDPPDSLVNGATARAQETTKP